MTTARAGAVRTRVRDSVVALLAGLEQDGTVRTVRRYNGELGHEQEADVMNALNGLAPAILVAVERGAYRGVSTRRRKYRRDLTVVLYLVSALQSDNEERADELALIEDAVLGRLTGVAPDIGGVSARGALEPIADEVMVHDPSVCIWRQVWRVTVEAELGEAPAPNVVEVAGSLNAPSEDDNAGDPLVQATTLITP